jgi:hypothetical protein
VNISRGLTASSQTELFHRATGFNVGLKLGTHENGAVGFRQHKAFPYLSVVEAM